MYKNDSCGKAIYMGNLKGPEKVNNSCVKTMYVGTMNGGFTVPTLSVLCYFWETYFHFFRV
jgi:hypothetical protein